MLLLSLVLAGCDLTKLGAYSCDEYCDQVLSKTSECAEQAAQDECEAAGGTDCDAFSEEQLAEYASTAREDWAESSRAEMVASCQSDITEAGKTDTACQAETATINNLTCDQILDTLSAIATAAQ
ncbi:MAG: hypothetical protein Q8P18_23645 [Pseudomonadota bacterium]|nr:hypothetical protein [Pseudomonadota bacterium]